MRAHHLAAELDEPAVRERRLLHPAAGPVARLEQHHVGAAGREVTGGRQAGEPTAQHHDVVLHRLRLR